MMVMMMMMIQRRRISGWFKIFDIYIILATKLWTYSYTLRPADGHGWPFKPLHAWLWFEICSIFHFVWSDNPSWLISSRNLNYKFAANPTFARDFDMFKSLCRTSFLTNNRPSKPETIWKPTKSRKPKVFKPLRIASVFVLPWVTSICKSPIRDWSWPKT